MTPARHARILWRRLTEREERVGFWLGLLLLFVPIFWFLLFFRRYSWLSRIGWGAWLGFIVFVKVFGLSESIIQFHGPEQPPTISGFGPEPADLPISTYVRRLLGSQYLDKFTIEDGTIALAYERNDAYFDNLEVLADLAISNGFSLMFRRDFQAVRFEVTHAGRPLAFTVARAPFLAFFGIAEADARSYADPAKLRASPVFNVTKEGKLAFIRAFAGLPQPRGANQTRIAAVRRFGRTPRQPLRFGRRQDTLALAPAQTDGHG